MMQWIVLVAALIPGQTAGEGGTSRGDPARPVAAPVLENPGPPPELDDLSATASGGPISSGEIEPSTDPGSPQPLLNSADLFPAATSQTEPLAGVPPAAPTEVIAPYLLPPGPAAAPAPPGPAAGLPDRWWLMRELQGTWIGTLLDDNRLYMTGWIEQSYTGSTDKVSNVTVVWNDRANQYLLQQGWFRFGRSVVTSGTTENTFGFQVDILTGSDYRYTLPRGLFNSQLVNSTGAQNLYGVDPIQEYVSMYVPTLFRGVEFRLGRLYTPWGVESLEAVSTPLLSRSYAFNWSPPFTHCGLAAYVNFTQQWSGVFMLANGNDVYFGDPSEELRFVGNLRWVQPGGRNTVTLATSLGRGKFNPAYDTPPQQSTVALATEPFGRNNFNAFDIVYTHLFNSVLSYNLEAIYGYQYNVPQSAMAVGSYNGFANWFSAANYLFWTISPKWSNIVRFETFDDAQGQRTGFAGTYLALTEGVQYRISKSMIIRPELRYDDNLLQAPYDGRHGIFTAASDLIIRW
ncbi:MAG: outer membrane beta-barrel protein [Gemmataceae bacterium]